MNADKNGAPIYNSSQEELFKPFLGLSPLEYYGLVKDVINVNTINDIARLLETIELPKGVVVATVGSDGKLERHAQSKTELIVLQKSSELQGAERIREFFEEVHFGELFDTGPDDQIDVKNLDAGIPLSYAFNDSDTIFPDRTLNMLPVYPTDPENMEVFLQAREMTLIEMSQDKRIKSRLKNQLREYRRAMRTGEYRNMPLFDTEKSEQYYSEAWPAYATGFKVPFLRPVQRKLDILTLNLEGKKDWSEVARELPTSTLDRIDYLSAHSIVPVHEATAANEAYAWFLQEYHCIQEAYKQSGETMTLEYDRSAFEAYQRSIENFLSL